MRQVYLLCKRSTYKYFDEYIDNLSYYHPNFIYNLIIYSTESNLIKQMTSVNRAVIISIRDMPNYLKRPSDNIKLYLNTEQYVKQFRTNEHGEPFITVIRKYYNGIIDYSLTNIRNMKRGGIKTNFFYLPYLLNPSENIYKCTEERRINNVPRRIDVGMIPVNSERRENIYQNLKKNLHTSKVRRLSGFGKERDEDLSRCKILVNIHIEKEYNIFETMRCHRLLYDRVIIISETSRDWTLDHHLNKHVIFADYDNIFSTVSDVLSNYDYYHQKIFSDFDDEKYREIEKNTAKEFTENIITFVENIDSKENSAIEVVEGSSSS